MASRNIPLGIWCLQKCSTETRYRILVLSLTFMAYTSYHLSRKPISVVKEVLHQNCTLLSEDEWKPILTPEEANETCWCCYKPFDQANAKGLLGGLDTSFLFAYAIGMFFSGHVAERMNLRYFLTGGMLLSGLFTALFGLGYFWNIHSYAYFVIIQIFGGLMQSSGWPSVVTCIGNWFPKGRRGIIMGIWNSHTSIGNILGSLIAAIWVDDDWGWSFIVPGIIIAGMGLIIFLFLVVYPEDVGCAPVNKKKDTHSQEEAISLRGALLIPGVVEFSLCLFFAKLVSYTFLYWLPLYISQVDPDLSNKKSADLSTLFDAGGIFGGILAGLIVDMTSASGLTVFVMLVFAAPMMFLYHLFGNSSSFLRIALLIVTGFFVNGPYALITTAVSADLGTHESLKGNAKALSTVTAIIDGTGSIGAAIGPLLAGLLGNSWSHVFTMLIVADVLAALLILRQVFNDIIKLRLRYRAEYRSLNSDTENGSKPLLQNSADE
ncbi:glucose-6-phosphate exchanger SLC37A2-like [Antedon mediterranea]|uniref:glucose-6-phosphate exchanger SLC37A2-like n=1 Tax=Antedon mediterranea TaxID=105859 RepID=UPI003AF9A6ED